MAIEKQQQQSSNSYINCKRNNNINTAITKTTTIPTIKSSVDKLPTGSGFNFSNKLHAAMIRHVTVAVSVFFFVLASLPPCASLRTPPSPVLDCAFIAPNSVAAVAALICTLFAAAGY